MQLVPSKSCPPKLSRASWPSPLREGQISEETPDHLGPTNSLKTPPSVASHIIEDLAHRLRGKRVMIPSKSCPPSISRSYWFVIWIHPECQEPQHWVAPPHAEPGIGSTQSAESPSTGFHRTPYRPSCLGTGYLRRSILVRDLEPP